MKFSTVFTTLLFNFFLPADVLAGCGPADRPGKDACAAGSGRCSVGLRVSTSGAASGASQSASVSYGRYCGFGNSCVGAFFTDEPGPDAPEPCDDLDAACLEHDKCLYEAGVVDRAWNPAPVEDSCPCDAALITAALGVDTTGLCDAAFYKAFEGTGVESPEALVIASGLCCRFLPSCGGACIGLGLDDVEFICGIDSLQPFIEVSCGL